MAEPVGSSRSTKGLAMKAPAIRDEPTTRPFSGMSGGSAPTLEGEGFARVEGERAGRLGADKRALAEAVEPKERHPQGAGRDHDAGDEADDGAGEGEMPERQFELCRASQCRTGTMARRKAPIARSTACEGSTRSVRAPSAAAGIPGIA